ncbi:hypothetical protein T36_2187 (plasmid) [Helicobacter cinaedi]|uniref:hypothetical protein n=1 Tax=Helicobacter cinaedi TaxID=213 RepID=UPI001F43D3A1|nr:hypothetical protein [Helicobacter cinaedi]BDB65708.1 hypothetical protein T36_2187 [Helicobacter cinaedi]
MKSRKVCKIGAFVNILFYVASLAYVGMFAYSYECDVNVDFVVFTMEHYLVCFVFAMVLPTIFGLFTAFLIRKHLTDDEVWNFFAFNMLGGLLSGLIVFCFWIDPKKNIDITNEQIYIVADLVKQEKVSKQSVSVKAGGFYNDWVRKQGGGREIEEVMGINRVLLEFYVCFQKGFHSPICAKLFENFLAKEKEKIRREKEREALARKNKQESIENYNRIIEKEINFQ